MPQYVFSESMRKAHLNSLFLGGMLRDVYPTCKNFLCSIGKIEKKIKRRLLSVLGKKN